ncbi:MAG: hypothetical protein GY928_22270 [Colwellia sp.]|nr:hypothetical protein [Colwellia sp.]
MHRGHFKIYRKIKDHWIYQDDKKLLAWFKILFEVNHSEQPVLIKDTLFTCKEGEALKSLETWARLLGKDWSIQKVRTFFKLLEKDNMIQLKNEKVTTRLTVCNYETYNNKQQATNKPLTSKQQATNKQLTTSNNVNNANNAKNDNKGSSLNKFVLEIFPEGMTKDKDFIEVWTDFEQVRKKKKSAISARAYKSLFNSLDKLSCGDLDLAIDIVAQSADKGYPNFYELPKEKK